MSIDPYDHVICIKCYYRDLLVKMLKLAFLGVYGYTLYHLLFHLESGWSPGILLDSSQNLTFQWNLHGI